MVFGQKWRKNYPRGQTFNTKRFKFFEASALLIKELFDGFHDVGLVVGDELRIDRKRGFAIKSVVD